MAAPASGVKPSAAELAALEHAFAGDPTSDAYRPLAEAYLALGRFMEAMVVCKKGVKARPTEALPRVLLARIYAEQNKDVKALEELAAGLLVQPTDAAALKLQASLLFKTGQKGPGTEALLKAHASAPADDEVRQLMAKFGVAPPAPPPPAAPPPSPAAPSTAAGQRTGRVALPLDGAPVAPRGATASSASRAPAPPLRRRPSAASADLSHLADELDLRAHGKPRGIGFAVTAGIALAGVVATLAVVGYMQYRGHRDRQITALLKKAQEALARDSYAGYQDAEKAAQRILELDHGSYAADSYLAYIDALRYGENGEGDDFRQRAQEFLKAAKAQNQPHTYMYAADAYLAFYDGDGKKAEQLLTEGPSGERLHQSHMLTGALGIIQLQAGKLTESRKNLIEAHNLAAADVRITAALGTVDSRTGSDSTAEAFFQQALKIDPDHVTSLLGLTLLQLAEEPANLAEAEKLTSHLNQLPSGSMSPRQSSFAKFVRAQLLYAQGKTAQAETEEKSAMSLDPRSAEMALIAGRRLRKAGQTDKAVALLRHAIELDPQRGTFYAELGEAYLSDPKGAANALTQLQDAARRLPENAKLLVLLGEAYRRNNQLEKAQDEWQKVLKLDSENVDAHLALARAFAAKGDAPRAKSEYEAVARHGQGNTLAEADTELGKIALGAGDANKARDLFANALSASSNYPAPYFYAGKLLLADKAKHKSAKDLFANYLRLAPDGPMAAEARKLSSGR